MRKLFYLLGLIIALSVIVMACNKDAVDEPAVDDTELKGPGGCWTIPGGQIYTSSGDLITPGFMENGYNYQAHIYNGEHSPGWHLVMKWSDSWLSNKDCDHDGQLDRPSDNGGTYIGSGAWCTNHWTTTYIDANGNTCEYDEFIKIVAVPATATLMNGYWYNEDGTEIGESIWGQFAIIQVVINDPCNGVEGVQYSSPDHNGLGNW
jgi:hypothetical protein